LCFLASRNKAIKLATVLRTFAGRRKRRRL
jgi:hypothetical protein